MKRLLWLAVLAGWGAAVGCAGTHSEAYWNDYGKRAIASLYVDQGDGIRPTLLMRKFVVEAYKDDNSTEALKHAASQLGGLGMRALQEHIARVLVTRKPFDVECNVLYAEAASNMYDALMRWKYVADLDPEHAPAYYMWTVLGKHVGMAPYDWNPVYEEAKRLMRKNGASETEVEGLGKRLSFIKKGDCPAGLVHSGSSSLFNVGRVPQ